MLQDHWKKILLLLSVCLATALLTGFMKKDTEKMETKQEITNKMKVEIWSDVMCPFCYIGKRRFENALAKFEHSDEIEIVWKSFQLNPNAITNPEINVIEDLARKKGWTVDYARDMTKYVTEMAEDEGLTYDFDNAVSANSFKAHRLLQFAKTQGKGDELKEKLLSAYFTEGKNTDDNETLINLGTNVGLDQKSVKEVVEDKTAYANNVNADIQKARELKINGVPFFLLDGKVGISGAQHVDSFEKGLKKAYKQWKKEQSNTIEIIDGPVCTPEGECK